MKNVKATLKGLLLAATVIGLADVSSLCGETKSWKAETALVSPRGDQTVVRLLEGSVAPVDCVNDPAACERSEFCVTRDIWIELKRVMDGVLGSTTLQDMVERHRKKEHPEPAMYYI